MVFSSTVFLFLFIPAVLSVYYICPAKLRNGVLFLASLLFYAWGEPAYIGIMLFSTIFDYGNGIIIEKSRSRRARQLALAVSVSGNLAILGFFKYSNFFLASINRILDTDFGWFAFTLPIGISFYTFQTMSYTIDVYRGKVQAQKNIIDFGTYVTMFPQLVAGPIVRYQTIVQQLSGRLETLDGFVYGIRRFLTGLFKKAVIANNIGLLWEAIRAENPQALPVLSAWMGAAAFSFQIYFDFSGYSDMAVGLGEMMGFHFPENFDHPYRSKSITEFWRRWHISLGTWFREYVYIPLGGSRCGTFCQVRNLIIVWVLTGFWHGASWNFIIWGLYFGILLILEKLILLPFLQKVPCVAGHIYTMLLVVISWMIFAFEDLSQMGRYFGAMIGWNHAGLFHSETVYYFSNYALLLFACVLLSAGCGSMLAAWIGRIRYRFIRYGILGAAYAGMFLTSVVFLVGDTYNPFFYFRF